MSADRLKSAIEQLTSEEETAIEIREEITELCKQTDVDTINQLPLLYRMEIKRVLEEHNEPMATQIVA